MICNPTNLLIDGRCFSALNPFSLQVAIAQLWCNVSNAIHGGGSGSLTNPVILSDDGNWYRISAVDYGDGDGSISIGDAPQPPGTYPYLVLANVDDGLRYKLSLTGTPPNISYTIDETPTLEALTPTILNDGSASFALNIAAGLTIELNQIASIINPVIQSDDGLWYQIGVVDFGGGSGQITIGDAAQPPSSTAYLVLPNLDDGLRYKLSLSGTPPSITYTIDETPTLEALNTVILTDGVSSFSLNIASGLTIEIIQL